MKKTFEQLMQPMEGARWVRCEDRQPPKYGTYRVIRRLRSHNYTYDEYLWNGGGWVTHGHSLSFAVEAWLEKAGEREVKP